MSRTLCKRVSNAIPAAFVFASFASAAVAQQVNPAYAAETDKQEEKKPEPLHTWELPPTVVTGERWSPFRESDLVGEYGQPRWSTKRLFSTTRTYVISSGQFEFEHWTRVTVPRHGPSTLETQYEFEIGLPGRFQLDAYFVTDKTGSEGNAETAEQKFELRYALADWGKLPWNPTLYAEWASVSGGPDTIETKLLLADEVSPGWKVGANLSLEHQVTGDLANEYQVALGVSRAVIDEKLSLGAEGRTLFTDVHDDRGNYTKELYLGPSLQWRPLRAMHLDLAPLIGIGSDSNAADLFVVLGWEF